MRGLRGLVPLTVFAGAAIVAAPPSARAVDVSHAVHATGECRLFYGSYGQVGVAGQVKSGFLGGDVRAQLYNASLDAPAWSGTMVADVSGSGRGALFLDVSQVSGLDESGSSPSGEFGFVATVTGGYGQFEGASGALYVHATGSSYGNDFDLDEISGTVVVEEP